LFSGYGGLDIAVQSVLGGELAWYSEIEPAACKVLAAHHPGVPNLGDITAVDWADVELVDVLTGGYPCQPFSHAGKRKGTNDERHLWPYVRDAIRVLRPRLTVLENVRGHLTLGFDTVLADLAELGTSARWGVVRAADAGAPHGRARLFIVVTDPADAGRGPLAGPASAGDGLPVAAQRGAVTAADAASAERRGAEHVHLAEAAGPAAESGERAVTAADADECGRNGRSPDAWRESQQRDAASGDSPVDWGKYAPAIARWERVLGRPAPEPTVPGRNGRPRLNPVLVEWMMGLPEGHVTGHGLSAAQELKMLGNGVVPQQAALALRMILGLPAVGVAQVDGLLPTPRAMDSHESPETFDARTAALQAKPGRNGGQTGKPLGVLVQELQP
jgi:DNA (cytosine-5)-methyltransferase 1